MWNGASEKDCSFFFCVRPFTMFLFHGSVRIIPKLQQNCVFHFFMFKQCGFMLQSRSERCQISIPLQHVILKYPRFQKKLLIINERKVYLQLKRSGC